MDSMSGKYTLELKKVGAWPFRKRVAIYREYDDKGKVICENVGYKGDFEKQYGMEKEDVFFPFICWGLFMVVVLIVQTMIWG